ncbi:hypothetical protein FH972_013291 [Carpinus fangiana]|uniref:RRM domain-containing protein n=1 Tax=Carpinus fangiana TaxID=176857 RepID=A0A5N6R7X0_9ROSI|nr:hypothetical protein FH972_013291 [Carpinus fangiana]
MTRIYVGNLDPRVTERDLEDEFRVFGVIESVWVARRPPGYAFIDFEDRRDADDAIRELDEEFNSAWRVLVTELNIYCKGTFLVDFRNSCLSLLHFTLLFYLCLVLPSFQEDVAVALPLDIGGAQVMVEGVTVPVDGLLDAVVCHLVDAATVGHHHIAHVRNFHMLMGEPRNKWLDMMSPYWIVPLHYLHMLPCLVKWSEGSTPKQELNADLVTLLCFKDTWNGC